MARDDSHRRASYDAPMSDVDSRLPGADLVERGRADLAAGVLSQEALLVAAAASRLRAAGVEVPAAHVDTPLHRLYELLAADEAAGAHSRYNALVGRMVSFARAAERAAAG
jgi:hypothetical protein